MTRPYLVELAERLVKGLASIDATRRERHRGFILTQQMPDGGFRGREGDSDLYYTGFALRCLSILGGLSADECGRVSSFLRAHDPQRLNVVDLVSWLYGGLVVQAISGEDPFSHLASGWADNVAVRLEALRTKDGGYAKTTEGSAGSTYHSFLVALAYELIGQEVPRPNSLLQFLYDRQRDDGGFVEIGPMKHSGTNPTAAAVALLRKLGRLDDEVRDDVHGFLRQVRSDEGGFQANKRIPFADGLSTFTGLLTCQDLALDDVLAPSRVLKFLSEWLEFPTGGFRGASWDEQADVEYTFYGLGTLALCAGQS